MGVRVKSGKDEGYGPSWYDAWIVLEEIRKLCGVQPVITVVGGKTYGGRWQLTIRLTVVVGGHSVVYGDHYATDSETGAATVAAAFYRVATRAYHEIESGHFKHSPDVPATA